jgi:predicted RNase H-like HicB family nuclease
MQDAHPLQIEVEREDDGRMLASVPELPGVMAYGATQEEAIRKAKTIALQVLADMIENGEEVPESLKVLFAA